MIQARARQMPFIFPGFLFYLTRSSPFDLEASSVILPKLLYSKKPIGQIGESRGANLVQNELLDANHVVLQLTSQHPIIL
ncbi:hypothetical protein BS47DRAFT_476436 [Hydnum rufescens UP504]|uniref:Uncharacterized protein n=1 Tax=Hydnum rufescens UP504 TaxID=1448309 RepID=A0A9P6B4X5_9AGAM|nr:hypothetical protein BS47DRAFT_476436 [Hydnum rufescens UP504]